MADDYFYRKRLNCILLLENVSTGILTNNPIIYLAQFAVPELAITNLHLLITNALRFGG